MITARCNTRIATVALTLAATTMLAAQALEGQRRGSAGIGARSAAGSAVEQAMRRADALELTQQQQDQLEALRVEVLEERTAQSAKLMTLASEVRAGIREPASMREELATLREAGTATRGSIGDRLGEILTDGQQRQLRQLTRRAAWRDGRGATPRIDRQRPAWRRGGVDRDRRWPRAQQRRRRGR